MRVILLFALLVFSFGVQSQEPTPTPFGSRDQKQSESKKPEQHPTTDQRGTEQFPVFVKTIPTQITKEEADRKTAESDEKASNERRVTYSTIWLAIVTTVLAIFTGYLWNATRRLVSESKKTAERQLRAYVAMGYIGYPTRTLGLPVAYFKIRAKNYGQSPAHQVTIWKEIVESPPKDYAYRERLVDEQMLHPTQEFGVQIRLPEGKDSSNYSGFYVYGRFVYRDIFNQWWITKFCYLCPGENRFIPWGEYNKEEGPYDKCPF